MTTTIGSKDTSRTGWFVLLPKFPFCLSHTTASNTKSQILLCELIDEMNQIRNEFEQLQQQQQQHSIEQKSSYSAHTNNVYSNWFLECHLACALCVYKICARVCVCWILYSNWVSVSVYRIKYQSKLNMHIVSIWMRSQENNTNNEHEPFRTLYALIEKKQKIKNKKIQLNVST